MQKHAFFSALALAIAWVPLPARAQEVLVTDGGAIHVEPGGKIDVDGEFRIAGPLGTGNVHLVVQGKLGFAAGGTLNVGTGAAERGTLVCEGGPGDPLYPEISTTGTLGEDHFSFTVASGSTLILHDLRLHSVDRNGISLQDGSILAGDEMFSAEFDWIEEGGTYVRFLHTSPRAFTVRDTVFNAAGNRQLKNIHTPAGSTGVITVDATVGNSGPRKGPFYEDDHGAGQDDGAASTISWIAATQILTIDNAVFSDPNPRLRIVGTHSTAASIEYRIQIDDDPAFGSPNSDRTTTSDPVLFLNEQDPADVAPGLNPGQRIVYQVNGLPSDTTYWVRLAVANSASPGVWSDWSEPVSFRIATTAIAPAPPLTNWYQSSGAQFAINTLSSQCLVVGNTIQLDPASLPTPGTVRTPVITLNDLHHEPAVTFKQWKQVVVGISHPNAATQVDVVVRDADTAAVLGQFLNHRLANGTSATVPLAGVTNSRIYIELTLYHGSTPSITSILAAGDDSTTGVSLTDLTATPYDAEVLVEWTSGAEVDNLGYNVYRSESPERDFARVSDALIPGLGDSAAGGRYYFLDQTVSNDRTYWYRIEDVEGSGRVTLHGPVSATPRAGLGKASVNAAAYAGGQVHDGSSSRTGEAVDADRTTATDALLADLGVRILSSDASTFLIEIDVPRFERRAASVAGVGTMDLVEIPGYQPSPDMDRPVVPTRNIFVEVPPVSAASVTSLTVVTEASGGYDLPANVAPPVPPPVSVLGPIPPTHDGARVWPEQALTVVGVVRLGDRTLVELRVNPVRYLADLDVLTFHPRIRANVDLGPLAGPPAAPGAEELLQATLATTQGVLRLDVSEDGVHRVTRDELAQAGFDVSGDPRRLWLYNLGRPVAIRIEGEADGRLDAGDALEFFGQRNRTTFLASPETRYSDRNAYWLAWSTTPGPRIEDVPAAPRETALAPRPSYAARARHELQRYSFARPFEVAGKDHWFSDILLGAVPSYQTKTYPLTLRATAQPARGTLRYRFRGASDIKEVEGDHRLRLTVNGEVVAEVTFDGYGELSGEAPVPAVREGQNDVQVEVLGGALDSVWLDFLELEHPRRFVASDGDSLRFTASAAGKHRVENLAAAAVEVWDVTAPAAPRRLTGGVVEQVPVAFLPDGSLVRSPRWQVTYDSPAPDRDTLVLVPAARQSPALALHAPTRALRQGAHGADYIVVAHRSLSVAAERLAAYRRGRGLRAEVVYLDEILDEFAFGNLDPEAIQRFVAHAWSSWALPRPRYVCLLGDGHYDFHDHQGLGLPNLLPPLMVEAEFSWTASDNRLVAVSGSDLLPDLTVGRLPVSTPAEAAALLDKIEAYEGAAFDPSWGQRHLLVADDTDIYDFAASCEELIARIDSSHAVVRDYYVKDADPTVNAQRVAAARQGILDAINGDGALFTVYSGHGNPTVWAGEALFSSYRSPGGTNDADLLTNVGRPTIGLVMNCSSGAFATPSPVPVIGEAWVRHAGGGAVAFWASTGLTRPLPQDLMGRHFMELVFSSGLGVLGDAVDAAKLRLEADGSFPDVIDTWVLLGDPALSIASASPQRAQPNPLPPPPPVHPQVVQPAPVPAPAPAPGPVAQQPPPAPAPANPEPGTLAATVVPVGGGSGGGCALRPSAGPGGAPGALGALLLALVGAAARGRRRRLSATLPGTPRS